MSSEFCNFATDLLLSHLLGEVFCRSEVGASLLPEA